MKKVYYAEANYSDEEIDAVMEVLKNDRLALMCGKNVQKLENKVSDIFNKEFGLMTNSGSSANLIGVQALNLKKGDEIIIPNFTIISNALAAIKQNLKIKLIDCSKFDWNMDISQIKKNISKKTKAIIATHIYNFPLRIDLLKKICNLF